MGSDRTTGLHPAGRIRYQSEKIASKFQNDAEQDGMMIYEVFTEAFETAFTNSVDECVEIAKRIQESI